MGILDALRPNPEKIERKAERAFSEGDAYEAYRLFREAVRAARRRAPDDVERLESRAREARLAFLEGKIEEAQEYEAEGALEAALEALEVAAEHLEGVEGDLPGRIQESLRRLRTELGKGGKASTVSQPEPAAGGHEIGEIAALGGLSLDLPMAAPSGPSVSSDTDELFLQYSAALALQDQERLEDFGEAFRKGFVALQQGNLRSAKRYLLEAEKEAPEDPAVLEHLGAVLDGLGERSEARKRYEKALKMDPGRGSVRLGLASLVSGGVPIAGSNTFEQRFLAAKGTQKALRNPSQRNLVESAYRSAIGVLEEGIERDPNLAKQYLMAAAEIALFLARPKAAAAFVHRVVESSGGNDPAVHHTMACALEMAGEVDAAEAAYRAAAKLGGHAIFYRSEFAEFTLRHSRALQEAADLIFETCLGCQATQPTAQELDLYGFLLSRIQFAQGKYKDALEGVERLMAKNPGPALMTRLASLRDAILQKMRSGA